MKRCVNGVIYEMTAQELTAMAAEVEKQLAHPPEATPEERIAQLEAALELLLSGVTE